MKNCSSWAAMSIMPAFFFLMSGSMTDAAFSDGSGITAPQLAVAILVGVLYTANHFKGRIKAFIKHLSSKSGKG